MRRRWPNCSATLSEGRVAADGTSVGTPLHDRSSWDARHWGCSRPAVRYPVPAGGVPVGRGAAAACRAVPCYVHSRGRSDHHPARRSPHGLAFTAPPLLAPTPAVGLGTRWGPHIPRGTERRPRSCTCSAAHIVLDVHEQGNPPSWGQAVAVASRPDASHTPPRPLHPPPTPTSH